MDTYKTILKRRSIRSFKQRKIDIKALRRMVNAARLAPSTANLQVLEFFVVISKPLCAELFKHLKWAGYIAPTATPEPGHEPVAYIIILINTQKVSRPMIKRDKRAIRFSFAPDLRDVGAAAENIMLFAQSKGIASCWLGAVNKIGIKKDLGLPKKLEVDSVIALGYPDMQSRVIKCTDSVKYFLNSKGAFRVPKRAVKEIMHINHLTR
ncbi:nitroreductase [bacterium]|nr:MAG: nitroreductase [bacterium]